MSDVTSAAESSGGSTSKLVYFFGALGGMLFGYDTGVISGAILFIGEDLGLTPFLEGLVVSSLLRLMSKESAIGYGHDISDYRPTG